MEQKNHLTHCYASSRLKLWTELKLVHLKLWTKFHSPPQNKSAQFIFRNKTLVPFFESLFFRGGAGWFGLACRLFPVFFVDTSAQMKAYVQNMATRLLPHRKWRALVQLVLVARGTFQISIFGISKWKQALCLSLKPKMNDTLTLANVVKPTSVSWEQRATSNILKKSETYF